jgi:hypothetical protein
MSAAAERVYLFDTTLRDGAQTTGVDFSLSDKRSIAALLDGLGIAPDRPLGRETFDGLPMPEKVWDEADPAKLRRTA